VAHGGEEFRFHPIGGLCFVAGLDEFRLTLLQQGNVRFDDNGATIGGVAFTGHHPFTVTGLFGYRGRGFAVAGQRSGTKLFLSEQYGIGGEYIGRGYDPSEISGDDALAGKVEVQWTSPQGGGFLNQHQFFAQYDYGATWFRSSTDGNTLSSFAAGVRLLMKGGYFASLEVAKPLTRPVEAQGKDGNDPRLFFVLSSNF